MKPLETNATRHTVFVYGTLKHGHGLHYVLSDDDSTMYCADGDVVGHALIDLGPFPGMIPSEDPDSVVRGEVYEVSSATLRKLDNVEGEGSLYDRKEVWVELYGVGGGVSAKAFAYIYRHPSKLHTVIASGEWEVPQ